MKTGLEYFAVEVSWGSRWVNINDGHNFKIAADQTRDAVSKTWRKTVAESPILGGNYLVHAVPEMVAEQVGVWVYGRSQSELADNFSLLEQLFEQMDYRMRWTFNDYREYWHCQLGEVSWSRGHVWTHSSMARASFTIPRYPNVTREVIG